MGMKGLFKRFAAAALAAIALTAGLIVMAPTTSGAATKPTTATWAELAGSTPNFILPYYPAQLCSVNNIEQFQFLMYRPLYWFGVGTSPNLNTSLSTANLPAFSNGGTTVTVNLKSYKWSNGESLTGQDVQSTTPNQRTSADM
jgi:peptide/nickel transport system substrate-binding protein